MKSGLGIFAPTVMVFYLGSHNAMGVNADDATSVTAPAVGVEIKSPDGKKAISFTCAEDQLEYFIIEKDKPEVRLRSNNLCREITAMGWTGDSRTVVVVIKEKNLQKAEFLHWTAGNSEHFWRIQEVKPPTFWPQIETVTDCQPGTSTVDLSYGIQRNTTAGNKGKYWNCRFTVSPATGVFFDLMETSGKQ